MHTKQQSSLFKKKYLQYIIIHYANWFIINAYIEDVKMRYNNNYRASNIRKRLGIILHYRCGGNNGLTNQHESRDDIEFAQKGTIIQFILLSD